MNEYRSINNRGNAIFRQKDLTQ